MPDDPRFKPCCEAWRHAHDQGTDSEGWQSLIWYNEDTSDQATYVSCVGRHEAESELPAVLFCPWCGASKAVTTPAADLRAYVAGVPVEIVSPPASPVDYSYSASIPNPPPLVGSTADVVPGSMRLSKVPPAAPGAYYRWPCGMFEDIGGPWQVFLYRPMPSTPAGDLVANFDSKEEADEAVAELNAKGDSLEDARVIWSAAGQYVRRDMKARAGF